ncbi:FGGY family carbohydrate kinase [Fulvivirgaceae bacterium BMA10]|uniref:FGGY family carbohydrate kinase n=1 Tax=Splendidivirga corallicola TaxID=3051826 RepID=A0ABT8KYH2_9BACT|nr:FGGY family carbohydrate kinase [Fulvivirgaceae bacterium BMA10]
MFLLGFDVGSSSIKASIVDVAKNVSVDTVKFPEHELTIHAPKFGWAEQDPELWWTNLCEATKKLLTRNPGINPSAILGIGISYQMHGLVLIDKHQKVLRPSIIWCDSRAVDIGDKAFGEIGEKKCLEHFLNSPGNFTASKLKWVMENEPEIYSNTDKVLLPGDFISMKMTGEINTTITGLSEGIFWDFKKNGKANLLLEHFGIDDSKMAEAVPSLQVHGTLTESAANELGLKSGTPVTYKAGDQPNNAMTLNALEPGEIAATGGTSGVIFAVTDQAIYDPESRVNAFAHVNHTTGNSRIGILMCINGCGIQYNWVRKNLAGGNSSYEKMEQEAAKIPVGSDGLVILPFGNGAERIFNNKEIGAQFLNVNLNRHSDAHFYRAALEGIAFSFVYGTEILSDIGISAQVIRVGNDNLFQSEIFSSTIASITGCPIEMYETTGAIGAARAAGVSLGLYNSIQEAFASNQLSKTYLPVQNPNNYQEAFTRWKDGLNKFL